MVCFSNENQKNLFANVQNNIKKRNISWNPTHTHVLMYTHSQDYFQAERNTFEKQLFFWILFYNLVFHLICTCIMSTIIYQHHFKGGVTYYICSIDILHSHLGFSVFHCGFLMDILILTLMPLVFYFYFSPQDKFLEGEVLGQRDYLFKILV